MTVFADSSALVKLYADEDGCQVVRRLRRPIVVSQLARVEVAAALWRKHRLGELGLSDTRVLVADFEYDWHGESGGEGRFGVVAPTTALLEGAAALVAVHGLRAYDAVQLSSALGAREASPDCNDLAAFDHQLREAAEAEGFGLVPG